VYLLNTTYNILINSVTKHRNSNSLKWFFCPGFLYSVVYTVIHNYRTPLIQLV